MGGWSLAVGGQDYGTAACGLVKLLPSGVPGDAAPGVNPEMEHTKDAPKGLPIYAQNKPAAHVQSYPHGKNSRRTQIMI